MGRKHVLGYQTLPLSSGIPPGCLVQSNSRSSAGCRGCYKKKEKKRKKPKIQPILGRKPRELVPSTMTSCKVKKESSGEERVAWAA